MLEPELGSNLLGNASFPACASIADPYEMLLPARPAISVKSSINEMNLAGNIDPYHDRTEVDITLSG
jgi:hypothetical protein